MSSTSLSRVRDKESKQRAILEAARATFAESGYEASYTRKIAGRAGCSEALIFRYFVDKRGLFERVVATRAREAIERTEAALTEEYPATVEEYVSKLFTLRILDTEQLVQWDASARGLVDRDFATRTLTPIHEARISTIAAGLRHYQDLAQIPADLEMELLAEVVGNLVNMSVIIGPRMFGTAADQVTAEANLGASVLARGIRTFSQSRRPAGHE
jgi:AcrR family transcriptional regulator